MYFLLIQLFVAKFFVKVSESTLNSPCTSSCSLPEMICYQKRCICDPKSRLFWTGARCLSCPPGWQMSEVACIVYDRNKVTWEYASTSCFNMRADLISFRDESILQLIYQATGGKIGRKRQIPLQFEDLIAWTSARLVNVITKDSYQWSDRSLSTFNTQNQWWCKMIHGATLGYVYHYNDPTRMIINGVLEQCVAFRRARSSPFTCLDDVLCDERYPFVCEKTELTAQKFGESIATVSSIQSVSKTTAHSNVFTSSSGSRKNTSFNGNNQLLLGILAKPHAQKSDSNTKSLILIVAICLLLMSVIAFGLFYFTKWRNAKGTQLNSGNNRKRKIRQPNDTRGSVISDSNISTTTDRDKSSITETSIHEIDNTPANIVYPPAQKTKRGGYSKQQFDEFE